jgi:hypothetical protein
VLALIAVWVAREKGWMQCWLLQWIDYETIHQIKEAFVSTPWSRLSLCAPLYVCNVSMHVATTHACAHGGAIASAPHMHRKPWRQGNC